MTDNTFGWSLTRFTVAALLGLVIALLVIGYLCPIRSILLSVWIAAVGGMVWYIRHRVERVYETNWYDTAKNVRARQEHWPEIDALMDDEPLTHESSLRVPKMKFLRDFVASLVLTLFFASTLKLIVSLDLSGENAIGFGDWALGVGVLALIGTGLTVFYQVRLTARTRNRNEWIEKVRGKMATLISLSDREYKSEKLRSIEIEEKITELELLLNPGEPLHRTFLALVRRVHGIMEDFDETVASRLPGTFLQEAEGQNSEQVSVDEWKARTVRLSNVILKYEWERVKHAE